MRVLQAIVFDYDGILADTEPLHLRAFQDCLRTRGVALTRDEYFERYLGLDDEGVFAAISEDRRLGWTKATVADLVADKAARFRAMLVPDGRAATPAAAPPSVLFPAVASLLAAWSRELPLAIASGSLREEIEPVLRAEGLYDAVPVIVAAGETERGKPWPDPYQRALDLLSARACLSLDPGRCVAVEDSPWGIDAAHAAGMRAVALPTSYPPDRLAGADRVIERFDLLDLAVLEQVVCSPQSPRR